MENGEIVSDSGPKKLARQLDFTTCRASENARLPVQLHSPPQQSSPPESQQRVQSQGQCQTQVSSQSKQQPESPLQQHNVQSPSNLPARSHLQAMHQLLARHNQAPLSHRTPHPVQKLPPPTFQLGKQESPRSRLHSGIDAKDGTPKKQKQCNCKNSRYCECFAAGIYCDGCNCINCHNNSEKEEHRQEAISLTLDRNPNAFRPKIGSSPHGPQDAKDNASELQMVGKHNKGCHCKKSGCLKKYCECFQAEVFCSENCKCMDCKNFEGSEERRASSQGYHNSLIYMQQAANAAINGAIGLSGFGTVLASKKRKGDEILSGQAVQDQSVPKMAQHELENPSRNSPAASSVLSASVSCTPNAPVLRSLKPTLRSPLANVLKPQDVKELCSVLVVLSSEVAKTLPGKNSERDLERESYNVETAVSCIPASETSEKGSDLIAADNDLSQNQANVDGYHNSGSNETNVQNRRPLSPGTRALMCEEEDAMFLAAPSQTALPSHCQNTSKKSLNEHERTEVYAEQERLVLTSLRDLLNRLITCGMIKQTTCSSPDKRSQQEPVENPAIQSENQTGCHKEPHHNGIVRSLNPANSRNV
ncbi:hypothetical protein SLEP1_g52002 [Rubroshorea leprosula]|uniref:CRC domain-containing protein n=1 Tax=Rubroshorea leprosula TaxID=152421 RepID=A0AAV5M783_9ROSI|nr:hypothetical protein SLEP1_g52002 [Rubroshorea leprosula]